MGLNKLYGSGASKRFAEALPSPSKAKVQEIELPDGTVRVLVDWEDGSKLKLHLRNGGKLVSWQHFSAAKKGTGMYKTLHDKQMPMWRDWGVEEFVAAPRDTGARKALMSQGKWHMVSDTLRWPIQER